MLGGVIIRVSSFLSVIVMTSCICIPSTSSVVLLNHNIKLNAGEGYVGKWEKAPARLSQAGGECGGAPPPPPVHAATDSPIRDDSYVHILEKISASNLIIYLKTFLFIVTMFICYKKNSIDFKTLVFFFHIYILYNFFQIVRLYLHRCRSVGCYRKKNLFPTEKKKNELKKTCTTHNNSIVSGKEKT